MAPNTQVPASDFIHGAERDVMSHLPRKPVKVADLHGRGINGTIALWLTKGVGTMWCAYAFAGLALIALPQAIQGGSLTIVQWISQTFIQLVMLSVIMVGQNILGVASDKRAEDTYSDADATFHLARKIQLHLGVQDKHLADQDARLEGIIQALEIVLPVKPGTSSNSDAAPTSD